MSLQVIRVLWGDDRDGCRRTKVWRKDVLPALARAEPCPFEVYCYGRRNADELTRRGVPVILVDDSPFPDGEVDRSNGSTILRPWRYKHKLLAIAAGEAPTIYVDWDVRIHAASPESLEDAIGDAPALLSAYAYRRPRAALRTGETRRDRRLTPSGNWIYTYDENFPEAVLATMRAARPESLESWHDEHAMKRLVGGWPGDERWLRGWESPLMVQRRGRCPWPEIREGRGPDGLRRILRRAPADFEWTEAFSQ